MNNLLLKIKSKGYTVYHIPSDMNNDKLIASCPNGHMRIAKIYNFIKGNCKLCNKHRNYEYTYDFVFKKFKEHGFTLIDKEYINCKMPMEVICSCGKTDYIPFDRIINKNQCCCKYCKGEHFRGKNHPNWNPNKTDEERLIARGYPEYRKWRLDVYQRDNFTCQCCHEGEYLNAHHLYSYANYKDYRTYIGNGITLCEDCHKQFHKKYGYGHNTPDQFLEFTQKYYLQSYDKVYKLIKDNQLNKELITV